VNSLGDFIAQKIGGDKSSFDIARNAKFAVFGGCISTPLVFFWYEFLDFLFKGKENGPLVILLKLILDQAIFSPLFYVVYYVYIAMIDGTLDKVPEKIAKDLIPVSIDSAKFWTIVQFVNFKFVPVNLRVLYGNLVSLGWNIYFVLRENQKPKPKTTKKPIIKKDDKPQQKGETKGQKLEDKEEKGGEAKQENKDEKGGDTSKNKKN
jgi:hypothetical protein